MPEERDKKRLVFVGNDLCRKRVNLLLDSFKDPALATTCTLTIVSRDPKLKELDQPAGVTLIPGLSRDQVRSEYQQSDLIVLPTVQDYSPNVLSEAAACGLPAISTAVGAIPELVVDDETGRVLSPEAGVTEWVDSISKLVLDVKKLRAMRLAARAHAEQTMGRGRLESAVTTALSALSAGT